MLEIRWHGRGGQGAIAVAEILATIALHQDLHAQSFPEYGPERSGAPVNAYDRISDEPIKLHCGVYEPDVVVVLDPTLLNAVPVAEGLKPEGALLVNAAVASGQLARTSGFRGKILTIPAAQLAERAKITYANVPMLGALLRILAFPLEVGQAKTREYFEGKWSAENVEALRLGYETLASEPPLNMKHSRSSPIGYEPRSDRAMSTKARLKSWQELRIGAAVLEGGSTLANATGGWRMGHKPVVDAHKCVNCLLCWVHCPEPAIITENAQMRGYDYEHCKGCGVCAEACPSGAISMIPEERTVPERGWLE